MKIHRIIGGRGSGKTHSAISDLWRKTDDGSVSVYVARNSRDADRCRQVFGRMWVETPVARSLPQTDWGQRHKVRFVSPANDLCGFRFDNITIDAPISRIDFAWIAEVLFPALTRTNGTITIVAADPWQAEARAWMRFREEFLGHCAYLLLTTCFAPKRRTQCVVPLPRISSSPGSWSIWRGSSDPCAQPISVDRPMPRPSVRRVMADHLQRLREECTT